MCNFFDDFTIINDNYLIKLYNSIINILNNKNNFKLLEIYYIYNINTLYKILKNNFNYDIDIEFRCCKMKYLHLLMKYLKKS